MIYLLMQAGFVVASLAFMVGLITDRLLTKPNAEQTPIPEGLSGALEAFKGLEKWDRIRFLLAVRKMGVQGVPLVVIKNTSGLMH